MQLPCLGQVQGVGDTLGYRGSSYTHHVLPGYGVIGLDHGKLGDVILGIQLLLPLLLLSHAVREYV